MTNHSDYDDKTVLINAGTQASTVDQDTVVKTESSTGVQAAETQAHDVTVQVEDTGITMHSETIHERLGISEVTGVEQNSSIPVSHSIPTSNEGEMSEVVEETEEATRMLTPTYNNQSTSENSADPSLKSENVNREPGADNTPVVGWLVVVDGPGKGNSRPIGYGNNTIGRNGSQRIPINFGDSSISSEDQAFLQYHHKTREFLFVPNLSKPNVVEVNESNPVSAVSLNAYDVIRMGETSLLFVPLCGPNFEWNDISVS
ncbi:MAG: FHA domain-containing protein [Methyloligellaceae bacterium]